jgi:hypothetical protein
MAKIGSFFIDRFLNGGVPLILMGALWLLLWLFPWFQDYINDPHWGHNFAESMAFLAVGLAYFNRKPLSDIIALLSALLIIPTALELLPHNITAVIAAVLVAAIIVDFVAERKHEGYTSSNRTSSFFKKYFPVIWFVLLASLAITYFAIRLPAGTYETDIDTIIFDALSLPLLTLLILENLAGFNHGWLKYLSFFWGMGIMIAVLSFMFDEPATWPVFGFVSLVTLFGIICLSVYRKANQI